MSIQEFEISLPDGTTETFVQVEVSQGHFTSMPKAIYEAQQAAQVEHLTKIIPADEA